MARAAVVIGINEYNQAQRLHACVNDSNVMAGLLENDGALPGAPAPSNMQVNLLNTAVGGVTTAGMQQAIDRLFTADLTLAVLYFSGHGVAGQGQESAILSADGTTAAPGVTMSHIMNTVAQTQVQNPSRSVVIILDCCNAGAAGLAPMHTDILNQVKLPRGITLLLASRNNEAALEGTQHGRFTGLLVEGLKGGAADLHGKVSPAALYAYVDKSLLPLEQRPIFATNISRSTHLRTCVPPIAPEILLELRLLFPDRNEPYPLDPAHEPDRGDIFNEVPPNYSTETLLKDIPVDPEKVKKYRKLQVLVRNGLVRPDGASDMFWAAVNSQSCSLTDIGKHYWSFACEPSRFAAPRLPI